MSVIGTITVHKCDDCDKIVVLHHESDIAMFYDTWFTGFDHDFCPDCKDKIANQFVIAEDEERIGDIVTRCRERFAAKIDAEIATCHPLPVTVHSPTQEVPHVA